MPLTALLPLAAVDGSAVMLLSARERAYIDRFRHQRRRHQALSVRLAGKWAYLTLASGRPAVSGEAAGGAAGGPGAPHLLSAASLAAFPAAAYAAVEILPPPGRRHGAPDLRIDGRRPPDGASGPSISLAHAGAMAGASIAAEGRAGLDIEDSEDGSPALRRHWLEAAELDWIDRAADADGSAAARLLTLLWTLKEALFKTGLTGRESLAEVLPSRLDLDFPSPAHRARPGEALAGAAGIAFRARSPLVPNGWGLHGTARSIGPFVVTALLAAAPRRRSDHHLVRTPNP